MPRAVLILALIAIFLPTAPAGAGEPAISGRLEPTGVSQQRVSKSAIGLLLPVLTATAGKGFLAEISAYVPMTRKAIVVESGTLSLKELLALQPETGLVKLPDGYRLRSPLIIWHGASLRIARGETLLLDGSQGAFIVNAGTLDINGASVSGLASGAYRPFILTASGASARMSNSSFSSLGFGEEPETAGLAFIGRGLPVAGDMVDVHANRFSHVNGLVLIKASHARIARNSFEDSGRTALALIASADIQIRDNIVIGSLGHGLKLSRGSSSLEITGNILGDNAGHGIFVDTGTVLARIANNSVDSSGKSGIAVRGSACIEILSNLIKTSGVSGVAITDSFAATVARNTLTGNRTGLSLQGQRGEAASLVSENHFRRNQVGIRADGRGNLKLNGNDFSEQWPRLFSGSIVDKTGRYLTAAQAGRGSLFTFAANAEAATVDQAQFSAFALSSCYSKAGG